MVLLIVCAACRDNAPRVVVLNQARTLAGASGQAHERSLFGELFGVAVGADETVYVSDGERGRIIAVDKNGVHKVIASNLLAPSGLAFDKRNNRLLVAETGAHVIRRIDVANGNSEIVAGKAGHAGFADGAGEAARFDAPIGLAINPEGVIFVTDSFNDAVRRIETNGEVKTVFGSPVRVAAESQQERLSNNLDTPCGIAVTPGGSLIIADTGNNRVRVLTPNGDIHTLQQRGQIYMSSPDAMPEIEASTDAVFQEPIGVAINSTGTIYVAEAGANRIAQLTFNAFLGGSSDREIKRQQLEHVNKIVSPFAAHINILGGASERYNFADGDLRTASFARPQGLAVTNLGEIIIADSDNKTLRLITETDSQRGQVGTLAEARNLRSTVEEFRAAGHGRWNHPPFDRAREIAATFGEVRGAVTETEDGRFHNGLDIPGAYGETVYAIRDEVVLRPVAVEGANGARERLRLPQLGYIHLRIGRDKNDEAFDAAKFVLIKDAAGKIAKVRVRRGACIKAGERVGTLNNQHHTHLIAGAYGDEMNPLAALELPNIKDTIAPTIEAVRVVKADGSEFELSKAALQNQAVFIINAKARVIARAFDRMDGGAERRRLGVHRLGYQILDNDKNLLPDFVAVRWTLTFDRLPLAARANGFGARTVYAAGSQAGYSPNTIFDYIVTNSLQDGVTGESFIELPTGDYVLRIVAADFFGNESTKEVKLKVTASHP